MGVQRKIIQNQATASIKFRYFNDWDHFLTLSSKIHDDDLFVLTSARKGAVSYISPLENLPVKLGKRFKKNTRVVIYPQ